MLKILIAEDDLASRKYLSKLLSQYGECDIVVDGLETIEAYIISMKDRKPYDLILLDIMLPKIDGVKVLKSIRELETQKFILPEKRVKIVMTTALAEAELVQAAFEYGCDAYVSKPINIEKLNEILENLGFLSNKS